MFQQLYDLMNKHQKQQLKYFKEVAKNRDGNCISLEYKNMHTPLDFHCNECKYDWPAIPTNIKHKGSWCPKCAGNLPLIIEEAQEVAKVNNGLCLSKRIINDIHKGTIKLLKSSKEGTSFLITFKSFYS